jgi:DNA-binding FrmR family transcriptional regulator
MHTSRKKTPLIHRVHRIAGQIYAIEIALNQERDCAAILQLVAAVRGATDSLLGEILEEHIRFHVLPPGERPAKLRKKSADQVVDVIRAYLK